MIKKLSNQNKITLTEEDYMAIVASLEGRLVCNQVALLLEEISRAEVVSSEEISRDIVTLDSKIVVRDGVGMDWAVTLVLPEKASLDPSFESIVSPMGAAVLGLPEGRSLEWQCQWTRERRRFTVQEGIFQPEAENRICVAS